MDEGNNNRPQQPKSQSIDGFSRPARVPIAPKEDILTPLPNIDNILLQEKVAVQSKRMQARHGLRIILTILILVIAVAVSLYFFMRAHDTSAPVATASTSYHGVTSSGLLTEGHDETPLLPDAISAYKVGANLPRLLTIAKLNIQARIEPMTINSDGAIQSPSSIYNTGWYTGSFNPNQSGTALIDGNVHGPSINGVFYNLSTLSAGDAITIQMGDNTRIAYQVKNVETKKKQNVTLAQVLSSNSALVLITSGMNGSAGLNKDIRVLVYADKVD